MKNTIKIFLLTLLIQSCKEKIEISSVDPINWDKRTIEYELPDSLIHGTTYLSVYSQIYGQTEQRTHDLTGLTEAALRGRCFDPGVLQGMQ